MSNYHSAMAAIARIGDNYFTGEEVNMTDFQLVFAWLQNILSEAYAEIQSNFTENLGRFERATSFIDPHLSDTGVSIVDRIRRLLAVLVAAFTYVRNNLYAS